MFGFDFVPYFLQCLCVVQCVVCFVGVFEEGFVHERLRVGHEVEFSAQNWQGVHERRVCEFGAVHVCPQDVKVEAFAVVRDPRALSKRVRLLDGVGGAEHVFGDRSNGVCPALHVFSFDGSVEYFFPNEQFGPEVYGFFRVLSHVCERLDDGVVAAGVYQALKCVFTPAHSDFQYLLLYSAFSFAQEACFEVDKGDHLYLCAVYI